ncbi:ferredoxin [Actinoalloteichus hoggarensis]|uniref:Ferredoxin n=1 Tax=Actinoalloteichus hoggarensis TaxID=1470176 RepID=A0A221W2F9_9PSEU|nr:ferredoxin [Actinoalloteichus hoggarensis]ASO19954.1 Ferredoxin-2 [Actinoalloteichus hoggarensis]MBB5919336.1 ferredoxin [Actinoalloteichus hoggarensis]
MRVEVDRDRCVGAGMCVLTCPEVFDQDEEQGRVLLLAAAPGPERRPAVTEAAEVCPSGAITVHPDGTRAPADTPGRA